MNLTRTGIAFQPEGGLAAPLLHPRSQFLVLKYPFRRPRVTIRNQFIKDILLMVLPTVRDIVEVQPGENRSKLSR